jgi:hypothetical protein
MVYDAVDDRVHCELTWSPDTRHWELVEPGAPLVGTSDARGEYDWGCVYASVPVLLENEIRIYYGASDDTHYGWRRGGLALATLRPDGFAGVRPTSDSRDAVGTVLTNPVRLSGSDVLVNAEARNGAITVAVLDQTGQVVATSLPLTGDIVNAPVRWEPQSAPPPGGAHVRLRFHMQNATLYSFSC